MYELGPKLYASKILDDYKGLNIETNPSYGALFKWNQSPRWAFRFDFTYIPYKEKEYLGTSTNPLQSVPRDLFLTEFSAGLEFNFWNYSRPHKNERSTPYLTAQIGLLNHNNKITAAIPLGIGYKIKVFSNIALSLESRLSYTFSDALESVDASLNTNERKDWYWNMGMNLVWTFGRPDCFSSPM